MFSVVLATMMTAAPATPAWGWSCKGCTGCFGCHGYSHSCRGCSGCYGSSCYGCSGGSSCNGCYGGSSAPWYWSCQGCWGGTCYGCAGCWGGTGCYGSGSCYGCTGGCQGRSAVPVEYPKAKVEGTTGTGTATVKVTLPSEAKLFVDNYASKQTSSSRTIVTPTLVEGQNYVYTIKATLSRDGRTLTESKDVQLSVGTMIEVDFGDLTTPAVVRVPTAPTQVSLR